MGIPVNMNSFIIFVNIAVFLIFKVYFPMIEISHTFPEITPDPLAPVAFASQPYPYNQISDDRRFEELLYSLAKAQLGRGQFKDFDEVSLMSGVAEKGRDCSLFLNAEPNGLIQCKKYDRNLDKNSFGREITKFALYSLLCEGLMQDPDNFTYFIAVSKGFSAECSDFIDTFKLNISQENSLSDWINYNTGKYESLKELGSSSEETLHQVRDILGRINVKKIIPQDLDAYLSDPQCSNLSAMFFQVKTVTDNSVIADAKEQIIQKLDELSLEDINIEQQLDTGSLSLKSERNEFSDIEDSHIQREETDQLLQWAKNRIKRDDKNRAKNFCLLAANAGMGKTVILKDLYDRLTAAGTAVLGLKADKLACTSINELQSKIGLSVPVFDFIEKCRQKYGTAVILIDQIDALSQSMSTDRSYLQVFRTLIEKYRNDEHIRIIISVRMFDLHYDPTLQVYSHVETVLVKPLSEEQVLTQLAKLGVHRNMLSSKLLELLRIPNHLNVFSRIYRANPASLGLKTLHDMYLELWTQKVTNLSQNEPPDRKTTKELLYNIAGKMFSIQHITVSELQFEDYAPELNYLKSERLLKQENRQLQFFHQSFYDFVFAKQFVERGLNLRDYIKDNGQTLLLRSAVKMILNYLRDYDPQVYIRSLSEIFEDSDIFFHIKHMALSAVLFNENPSSGEKEVAKDAAKRSYHLMILFFQRAYSSDWFALAYQNNFLAALHGDFHVIATGDDLAQQERTLLKNITSDFLQNAAMMEYPGSWKFISELPDQSLARRILRSTVNWDDPLKYSIFESCKDFKQIEAYGYYRTVGNIAKVNPDYAADLIAQDFSGAQMNDGRQDPNGMNAILNILVKSTPTKLFHLLFANFQAEYETAQTEQKFWGSYRYMQASFRDRDFQKGRASHYVLLAHSLRNSAHARDIAYVDFYQAHKNSKILPLLRLLIFATASDENFYAEQIFELSSYVLQLNELNYDSTIGVEMRILFQKSFPFFSPEQKKEIITLIKGHNCRHEVMIFTDKTGRKKLSSWWGLSKYSWIKRLPIDTVNNDPELRKAALELQRKFPDYVDKEKSGHVIAGMVQTPLPQKAYDHMQDTEWLNSFKKYNGSKGDFDRPFLKGDIEEHSIAFKKSVADNPTEEMLGLIVSALDNPDIDPRYPLYGIWGFSETAVNKAPAVEVFNRMLTLPLTDQLKRVCRYIAENLSRQPKDDPTIISFLLSSALNFSLDEISPDSLDAETSVGNLITQGLNTASGSAASALVHIIDENYFEQIFSTLQIILETAPDYCKAATLHEFAYLMNADPDRAFEIFKNAVTDETNIHVLASSLWSMQYMANHDFEPLIPALQRLVSAQYLGSDDSELLFYILYFSYLRERTGAQTLLYSFLEHNKYVASFGVRLILQHYYDVPSSEQKSNQLLLDLLNKLTEEDFDNYGVNFYDTLNIKLPDISAFLKQYIQSPFFRINDSLIEYLTVQCADHAYLAIEIFQAVIDSSNIIDDQEILEMHSQAGTKFILSALSSLDGNDSESINARRDLTLAFDKVLMDQRFSRETEKILDEADL